MILVRIDGLQRACVKKYVFDIMTVNMGEGRIYCENSGIILENQDWIRVMYVR